MFCRQKPKLRLTQILAPYVRPSPRNKKERGGIFPPYIGFGQRTCQRRPLLRDFKTACGPLGPEGRSLTENMSFGRFSAGLRRSNQLAAVGGILVFRRLAAIFAELEFAGLLNRQHWADKRSG